MDLVTGTSGVLVNVAIVVEFVKSGVENGTEIRGSETPTENCGGRGSMVIVIMVVIREDGEVFI